MGNSEFGKKAPLELLCLSLLQERDMYGYEMLQELSKRSKGLLSVNLTTLYMALKRLNERGYVSVYYKDAEGSRERSRAYYKLEPGAAAYRDDLFAEYSQTVAGVQNFFDHGKGEETDD